MISLKRSASVIFLGLGLTLVLLCLLSIFSPPTRATRLLNIGGSTVTPDHTSYQKGASNVYSFTVYNASPDDEWLDEVQITFPNDWTVTAAVKDVEDSEGNVVDFSTDGIGTPQIAFTDDDGDGGIADGCSWHAVVTVTAPVNATGNKTMTWSLAGDEWPGTEAPHDVTGTHTIRPWLTVFPTELHFSAIAGGANTSSKNISILNYGKEQANWSVPTVPEPWLEISPRDGEVSPTQGSDLTVSAIISGLALGEYTDTIQISGHDGSRSTQIDIPVTLSIVEGTQIYLPLVLRTWPPIPETPVLNAIAAPGANQSYLISWSTAERAETYVLQEATNSNFSNASEIYSGASTSHSVDSRGVKRYYYRVKGRNASYGDGDWSNIRSVDVRWEEEPNDNAQTQANGPIDSGPTYYGIFPADDPKDYFYFDLSSAHSVELWLTNIAPGEDYDVYLRDAALDEVSRSDETGSVNEHIQTGVLSPGRYYIHLYNYSASGSTQPYHLRVVYQ